MYVSNEKKKRLTWLPPPPADEQHGTDRNCMRCRHTVIVILWLYALVAVTDRLRPHGKGKPLRIAPEKGLATDSKVRLAGSRTTFFSVT
ncbi:uncharacterized protein BO97DRAFT_408431 [Aspergillus homomorphus CBS 101889]|uniref:Uncharacterized protein n=1 Tax=Aspergillus homomorphus (strain CBS 101889) TaxID=1450537 RepID=A0A395HLK5_ASPHC|nr:hypothetical protein BO97DRAFT_408431 [Aspergillus homomorphus CBS 101889]RAL08359.1 hypothetical protein BO97DRAFT_408431 [Aspergillus homomorphus CBS 101889]